MNTRPDLPAPAGAEPVTVVIRRHVKPGCEAACAAWLQRLQADAPPGALDPSVTTHRLGSQVRRAP